MGFSSRIDEANENISELEHRAVDFKQRSMNVLRTEKD